MHTQEKTPYHTYEHTKNRVSLKKQRNTRRHLRIKCLLSVSVFSLTLLAAFQWNLIQPESDFWKQYAAKATTLQTSKANDNGHFDKQTLSAADPATDPAVDSNAEPATEPVANPATEPVTTPTADPLPQEPTDAPTQEEENKLTPKELSNERLKWEQHVDTTAEEPEVTHIASVSDDWNLILVNPWNEIPKDYEVNLAYLPNGQSIDSRCYAELTEMMDACTKAGLFPLICSSYRTQQKQESLFQERIDELLAQGYTEEDAHIKAATSVARPGTSEHQVGLAVDIVDSCQQSLDSSQEHTMVQQWLMANSWKYGFILRYPSDKSSLTGIIYEPWHYRYVGKKVAKQIYKRGICLEEYLEELKQS